MIILVGALAVTSSGCRNSKKDAQSLEVLRMRQDSIRRADEQRILELQIKAREDSIALALASNFEPESSQPSTYYVVVGSFRYRDNANGYLRTMRSTFSDAQIVRNGGWSYVCVGGSFGSYESAASTLSSVKSQLGGGGGSLEEDEDEDDEEDTDLEEDTGAEDEGDEDEEEEEEEEEDFSGEEGGQAWVLGI